MDKVLQILVVFAMLMLVINYSVRARENRFRVFYLFKQITLPFPGDREWDNLSAKAAEEGPSQHAEPGHDGPVTRATDQENQLFFSPGQGATILVQDIATEEFISTILVEEHADQLAFDPVTRLIYGYSREGALTIIRQTGRDRYKIMQHLIVPKACTGLMPDPQTGKIYLAAESSVFVYFSK